MTKRLITELPDNTKTATVMYADKPLKLGGIPREITTLELSQHVSHPFNYSDALFSKKKHPNYLMKGSTPKNYSKNTIVENFKRYGFTNISSFVICQMGQLGHGVFANRDFEPGECFILYAGVITDDSELENQSAYNFSYGKELTLSVDAAEVGNISRFIQHMPLNYHLASKHMKIDKEEPDFWQWRNIDYKADLSENQIAWANLSYLVIASQDVPQIIFFNTKKINKGEQLGISYGNGYWIRREIKPELFDLEGNIISGSKYGYKEIPIVLPPIKLIDQFPEFKKLCVQKTYTAAMFKKDLQRQEEVLKPVWFSHLAEPISIFKLRESLLHYNVIGKEYQSIENEFILKLRNTLPDDFTVKMYVRDPSQLSSKPIYDVVCTVDDLMKWSILTAFIKGPMFDNITIQNKCLKLTQEVILMGIGDDLQKQMFLLAVLNRVKKDGFFMKAFPKELIPSGPTHKDATILIQPSSQESIDQILFHNPGLTWNEIQDSYEKLESAFGPKNLEKEKQVSTKPTLFSSQPSDYLTQAKIAYQQRKYQEAIKFFEKAAKLSQDNDKKGPIFCNIGHSHFALKDYKRAVNSYTYVLDICPMNITAYVWRAKSYKKLAELSEFQDDKETLLVKASQDENKISELKQHQSNRLTI